MFYSAFCDGEFAPVADNIALQGLRLDLVNGWRLKQFRFGNKTALDRLFCIDAVIEYEIARLEADPKAKRNDGLLGNIAEPCFSTQFSRKLFVAKEGDPDIFIKWQATPSSEVTYEPCEFKTGNGDISKLYKPGAPRFVAYCYVLDNSNGRRFVEPQIMLRTQFLEMLERNGLTQVSLPDKDHPTTRVRVKGQSSKLFKWLDGYGLPLDPDAVYTPGDFEDVDLNA